jgi:hypothetical protein
MNELIGAIHEKDELLDSQEEFLIKEMLGLCFVAEGLLGRSGFRLKLFV